MKCDISERIDRLLSAAVLGLGKHKPGPGTISDQPLDLRRTPLHYQSPVSYLPNEVVDRSPFIFPGIVTEAIHEWALKILKINKI